MKILVVGNGGREHALTWNLLQSPQVENVYCAPGNGGTATLTGCHNLPLKIDDFCGLGKAALELGVHMVVIGPEVPLEKGISDYLQSQGLMVFGPTRVGAQIETSKIWSKKLMQAAGIPTPQAAVFTQSSKAKSYIRRQGLPIVVKADGLAGGKGVTVATTVEEAEAAVDSIFQGKFGSAGKLVLIEEYLTGQEVSVLALTDGLTIIPLLPAQDYKRIGEGDTGDNTGGMGAYAPVPIATPELMVKLQEEVFEPAINNLRARKINYCGVLYAGLMISHKLDFKVLEFNSRFGDPETQVILPLLETPLEELMLACVQQRLALMPSIKWKQGVAATIVASSGGYPGYYEKGKVISGIRESEALGVTVFHAGTRLVDEQMVTDGGRVLNVTATGETLHQALGSAYAGIKWIEFEGIYYRRDIGYQSL